MLHMDKFKKDAIRGIQSHNRRERESHSNPDIDYIRSPANFELCDNPSANYGQSIQNRIDDLFMVKAVRKDAVHMCGLIICSDREFFDKLTPEETRKFFEEVKIYLTEFAGKENVISAMIHLDEKTPHMHFLHVPVTKDGRLCAKDIYTKKSLKKLQDELPKFLQGKGFLIERGVEQVKGSAKKHLDTREFKQHQEILNQMQKETENLRLAIKNMESEIDRKKQEETEIEENLKKQKDIIAKAEEALKINDTLPPANFFNYKSVLAEAENLLATFRQALLDKEKIASERDMRVRQADFLLEQRDKARETEQKAINLLNSERKEFARIIGQMKSENQKNIQELECLRSFISLNGLIERFREFLRSLQIQKASDKAQIRQQSQMPNSSCVRRMR